MISDHFAPAKRLHFRIPLLLSRRQPFVKILKALLEVSGVAGIHFAKLGSNSFGDAPPIVWIEPVVRVPEGTHVAHGACNRSGGNIENFGELRGIEIARRSLLNPGISTLRNERRQPTDFQLQTDHDQQVSLAQLEQKAWLGLDEVRILIASGNRFHVDLVTSDLLSQGSHISGSGNDIELFGLCHYGQEK